MMLVAGSAILALVLAASPIVEAKTTIPAASIQASLHKNSADLIRKAVPLRQLQEYEENQDQIDRYANNNEYFQVTANDRVQFRSCLSMTVENYSLHSNQFSKLTEAGQLHAVQNFVLFDVCDIDYCEDTVTTYAVDLETFLQSRLQQFVNSREDMCQACDEQCNGNYEEEDNGEEENNAEDGQQGAEDGGEADGQQDAAAEDGGRRLENDGQQYQRQINCQQCNYLDCEAGEGEQEVDYDGIMEWVEELGDCRNTGVQWYGMDLYSSFTCNSDGSGIDVGMFLDQYCMLYHTGVNFGQYATEDDYMYIYQSQMLIPYIFRNYMDCSVVNDADEELEGCELLFDGRYKARPISNCAENQYVNNAAENGEENMYDLQRSEYYYMYTSGNQRSSSASYNYDLSIKDMQDEASICEAVASVYKTEMKNGGVDNVADVDGDFDYTEEGTEMFDKWSNSKQQASTGMGPLAVTFLVLFAVAVTVLAMTLTKRVVTKRKARLALKSVPKNDDYNYTNPEVYETEAKKTPLIS